MHDQQPPETFALNMAECRRHLVGQVGVERRMVVVSAHNCDAPAPVPRPSVLLGALDLHGTPRLLAVAPAFSFGGRLVGLASLDARHVVPAVHTCGIAVGRCVDGERIALRQCPLLEVLVQVLEAGIETLLRRREHRPRSRRRHCRGDAKPTRGLMTDCQRPGRVTDEWIET